ncbi:poly(ethylene terephthalate) hydrolase family protein [Rhizobacter sp. LjRoot28]|jgi:predicted dienelactone hydrolase|uniref:poly(ethylene terephthalate) hydrolase family protein n=1 Tax=Rhizobacter sp. LjRoot28 TaxID=3342309 RepID=UPI003ECC2C54
MTLTRWVQALLATVAVAASTATVAQSNPFERGPAPTSLSLAADRGPMAFSQFTVSRPSGYRAGTVYYPTNAGGTVGAIVVVPGFTAYQSDVNWWGPRLASWGFVVMTIDTFTTADQPDSRSRQQLAALDQLAALGNTPGNPIYGKVDASRMGVMGWSMGGGGSLVSTRTRPSIKASIPFAPWNNDSLFGSVSTPTLIIACQADVIAPTYLHAGPFYMSLNSTKAYMEMTGGTHYCANSINTDKNIIGAKGVAWMKRFMDNDTRFTAEACGNPYSLRVSDYKSSRCN